MRSVINKSKSLILILCFICSIALGEVLLVGCDLQPREDYYLVNKSIWEEARSYSNDNNLELLFMIDDYFGSIVNIISEDIGTGIKFNYRFLSGGWASGVLVCVNDEDEEVLVLFDTIVPSKNARNINKNEIVHSVFPLSLRELYEKLVVGGFLNIIDKVYAFWGINIIENIATIGDVKYNLSADFRGYVKISYLYVKNGDWWYAYPMSSETAITAPLDEYNERDILTMCEQRT